MKAKPRLDERLALTLAETAGALGISERTLRSVSSELPHFHLGRRILFPVGPLRLHLEELAKGERARIDGIADEILQSMIPTRR